MDGDFDKQSEGNDHTNLVEDYSNLQQTDELNDSLTNSHSKDSSEFNEILDVQEENLGKHIKDNTDNNSQIVVEGDNSSLTDSDKAILVEIDNSILNKDSIVANTDYDQAESEKTVLDSQPVADQFLHEEDKSRNSSETEDDQASLGESEREEIMADTIEADVCGVDDLKDGEYVLRGT